MSIYLEAWKLLLERLERKTGWGKEEVKRLMLQCLLDAGDATSASPTKSQEGENVGGD